ncbi:MAG TPA: hypothetical protein VNB94_06760 [Mycobacteriales bacterium]|nr:hypothetical protein [Mycobacteriales bacterium]
MSEEITPDQETYDAAIAAGDSDRVARAKAKSAAVKKSRKAAGVATPAVAAAAAAAPPADGSAAPEAPAAAAPAAAAISTAPAAAAISTAPAAAASAGAAVGTATMTRTAPLSPAERQARVAAAVAKSGGAVATGGGRGTADGMTHRLLAMVPPEGIQRVERTQDDKVNVWPHLLVEEMVALLACTAFLTVFSTFVDAPLLELANVNLTPNPSKAPWYFLGLQELLRYFHPMIAGVTIPGVGLVLLMAFPYLDKNPSVRPANRKFSIMLFTWFVIMSAILSTIGSLFRGPGYNWVWPWSQGLYFEF